MISTVKSNDHRQPDVYYINRLIDVVDLLYTNHYSREDLTQIEENQLEEIKERERILMELEDETRLSSCFVEFLNEHQLFDSLFVADTNGHILRLIGEEAEELINVYCT